MRIPVTSVPVDDQEKALRFYIGPLKDALVQDGIPYTSFAVDDVAREHERLSALGVRFTHEPVAMGDVTTAVLDDTCGNLIQIAAV
jgi:catechol 2,3-dioxygenase-like lactoylglutathione lyase family enzyme